MKIWTSEHIFDHPWGTVVKAALRKYPNPHSPSVIGTDVVDRKIENGVLKSHRLLTTEWGLSPWVTRLIGADRTCFASEHSEIDVGNSNMTLRSRNLTFCNFLTVDEKLVYLPHPEDPSKTLLIQEAVVTVRGVPLTNYMEGVVADTISKNANKGRMAMEWVIGNLKVDVEDLSNVCAFRSATGL